MNTFLWIYLTFCVVLTVVGHVSWGRMKKEQRLIVDDLIEQMEAIKVELATLIDEKPGKDDHLMSSHSDDLISSDVPTTVDPDYQTIRKE